MSTNPAQPTHSDLDPGDLLRVARHIQRNRGLFSLVFLRWERADKSENAAKLIQSKLQPNFSIARCQVTTDDPITALHEIETALGNAADVLIVENLSTLFPDFVKARATDRPAILRVLNLERERLRQRSVALAILLPDYALNLVAQGAPDFWSWRSGIFNIEPAEPISSSTNARQTTANSLANDDILSRADAEHEIASLTDAWDLYAPPLEIPPRELDAAANIARRLVRLHERTSNFATAEHWRDIAIRLFDRIILRSSSADAVEARLFQANLWLDRPIGDHAENLRKAIDAFEAALTVYTRDDHPAEWAGTQNNLGNAWANMPTGDNADNLRKAIHVYEAALTVRTREDHPVDWAMIQNNLGNAWQNMPTGDKADNLRKAIHAYETALTVRTRDDHPADWAATQNNLGAAWQNMPTGDKADNLRKAIHAYEAALTIYTRDDHPVDWAATQNNLGAAWQNMPTGDKADNLRKAIHAYEAALTIYTRDDHPTEWATTQNNLAIAFAEMADLPGEDRCSWLRRAIASGKAALTIRTPQAFPHDHAACLGNLQIDCRTYEAAGCAIACPIDSIPPAQ